MIKTILPMAILALVLAVVMSACSPAPDRPLEPRGYSGETQLWEETATGCMYSSHDDGFELVPVMGPNGRHIGCRA